MVFNRSLSLGELKLLYENKSYMLSSQETQVGNNWMCQVTPVSEAGAGETLNSSSLTILDLLSNLSLTPSANVNITNEINGSATYTGYGLGTIIFNWWKNTILWVTKTFNNVVYGTIVSDVLGWGNYSSGDNITLQTITTDEGGTSILNSSTLLIHTTPPFIYNISLEDNTTINYYHEKINCSTTFSLYEPNATVNFTWYNQTSKIDQLNSSIFIIGAGINHTLYSPYNLTYEYQNIGYNYTCNITIYDGQSIINGTSITTQIFQQINETTIYNANVTEGSLQLISGNVTWTGFINTINATLIYDNITYSTNKYVQANSIWFNTTIPTPILRPASYFQWNFTVYLNDGNNESNILSQIYQQNFTTFTIDNCTNNTLLAINFTLKDEETKITIPSDITNSSIEVDFIIKNMYNPNANWTYHHLFTNMTNAKICVKPESLNQTGIMVVEGVTSYKSIGYVQEYYYFDYLNISNNTIPHNINLYDLASSKSTSFLVTFYDCQYTKITGAIINVWRRYIADGEYLNVEMGKTSVDGQTILHLNTEDTLYKYWITKNGKFLWENPESPAICLSAPCQLNIYQQCGGTNPVNPSTYENVQYDLTSNKTSRQIILSYNTLDGSSPTMTMNITRFTNTLNDSICTETTTGAGGTLTCTVPLSLANATYYINVQKNGKSLIWGFFDFSADASTYFGKSGLLLSSLAILTLVLMGATTSGVAVIVFALLGLIFSSILYFLDMGYGTLIWVVIAGVIIIYKIARRQSIR